ncbi:MAG TPA: hypothetical protein VGB61_05565 [Pyrinomonadaceae bacterium]|jgi:hypothetical protein
MRKLLLAATLTMIAAGSAQAQVSRRPSEGDNNRQAAMRDPDPVRREERMISISSRELRREHRPYNERYVSNRTFKARVSITNHSTKTIKSVSWMASLVDPATGQLIRSYPVTTEKRIAPGGTKKLETKLPLPMARVVRVGPDGVASPTVADLKSTVVQVTYEDGSTSETP